MNGVRAQKLQRQREDILEPLSQALSQGGASVDRLSPQFGEDAEGASGGVIGPPRAQFGVMLPEEIDKQVSVRGVVLGSAGGEGFAVACELFGINWEEDEEFIPHERMDHTPTRLFDADRAGFAVKACAEFGDPGLESVRVVFEGGDRGFCRAIGEDRDGVLVVAPIDADVRGEFDLVRFLHEVRIGHVSESFAAETGESKKDTLALVVRMPYRRVLSMDNF